MTLQSALVVHFPVGGTVFFVTQMPFSHAVEVFMHGSASHFTPGPLQAGMVPPGPRTRQLHPVQ